MDINQFTFEYYHPVYERTCRLKKDTTKSCTKSKSGKRFKSTVFFANTKQQKSILLACPRLCKSNSPASHFPFPTLASVFHLIFNFTAFLLGFFIATLVVLVFKSSRNKRNMSGALEKATVIYRDTNARNIVFRDEIRRQAKQEKELTRSSKQQTSRSPSPLGSKHDNGDSPKLSPSGTLTPSSSVENDRSSNESSPGSSGIRDRVIVEPLPPLDLGASDVFHPLLNSSNDPYLLTKSEKQVLDLLGHQKAVVKTIRHSDVKEFLQRFKPGGANTAANDVNFCGSETDSSSSSSKEDEKTHTFRTSVSLLPSFGKKMRSYGSVGEFNTGVVFALPECTSGDAEDEAVVDSGTWIWPR